MGFLEALNCMVANCTDKYAAAAEAYRGVKQSGASSGRIESLTSTTHNCKADARLDRCYAQVTEGGQCTNAASFASSFARCAVALLAPRHPQRSYPSFHVHFLHTTQDTHTRVRILSASRALVAA